MHASLVGDSVHARLEAEQRSTRRVAHRCLRPGAERHRAYEVTGSAFLPKHLIPLGSGGPGCSSLGHSLAEAVRVLLTTVSFE